jgi:hypothetical protein
MLLYTSTMMLFLIKKLLYKNIIIIVNHLLFFLQVINYKIQTLNVESKIK